MSRLINLCGEKFGRLTVVERAENDKSGRAKWKCLCLCSSFSVVSSYNLISGGTTSCGCFKKQRQIEANIIHGFCKTPEFRCWVHIRQRCNNKNDKSYKDYGGRGIKVCRRWNSFQNFLHDMGERPAHGWSIDRINNDGDYTPKNCRWASKATQNENKRKSIRIKVGKSKMTINRIAVVFGKTYACIYKRYKKGKLDVSELNY